MDIIKEQGGLEKYMAKNFTQDDFDKIETKKGNKRPIVEEEDEGDYRGRPGALRQDDYATEKKHDASESDEEDAFGGAVKPYSINANNPPS